MKNIAGLLTAFATLAGVRKIPMPITKLIVMMVMSKRVNCFVGFIKEKILVLIFYNLLF
jgi:hypothetical protein